MSLARWLRRIHNRPLFQLDRCYPQRLGLYLNNLCI